MHEPSKSCSRQKTKPDAATGAIKNGSHFTLLVARFLTHNPPASVSPNHTEGHHLREIIHGPPRSGDFEPILQDVTMGALDLAHTKGQILREGSLVIQALDRLPI